MKRVVVDALRGVRWYLKEATGESRWDDYLAHCRAHGTEPMPRKAFERQRAEHRERCPQSRCC